MLQQQRHKFGALPCLEEGVLDRNQCHNQTGTEKSLEEAASALKVQQGQVTTV